MSVRDVANAKTKIVLTAYRTQKNDHHRSWTVLKASDGKFRLTVRESADVKNGPASETSGPFTTWEDAVRSDPALTSLRAGETTKFKLAGDELALASMLTCEAPDSLDEVSWPSGQVGFIGPRKIFFVPRPDNGGLVAILGDESEIAGDSIAEYSWSDNYFPMSTTYTSSLIEFAPGLGLLFPTGDLVEMVGVLVIALTDDPDRRASGVQEWLSNMAGAWEAAVFALEPLDPNHYLSDKQRAGWEAALEDDRYSLTFYLDDATGTALRDQLRKYTTYEYIREGLANPLGAKGAEVYRQLTEDDILTARF